MSDFDFVIVARDDDSASDGPRKRDVEGTQVSVQRRGFFFFEFLNSGFRETLRVRALGRRNSNCKSTKEKTSLAKYGESWRRVKFSQLGPRLLVNRC